MELRHLRYFVAVAEEGNISRAAQRLHLTQPALSRQIKALEDEIGLCLLERKANSVQLTEPGQTLLREGREVLARADLALERVQASAAPTHLRVGYAPSLTFGLLPVAIERFTQIHPRVRVELWDLSSTQLLEGLAKGTLDLIVTAIPDNAKGVTWTQLQQHQIRLAVNKNHPLAKEKVITPAQLHNQRLLLFCQNEYPEYWQRTHQWFRSEGIDAKVAGQYDGITSLIAAVEAGLGAALVSERTRVFEGDVLLKPIKPAPQPICIGVGVPAGKESDAVAAVFVGELLAMAKQMS
jgi:DNA-binding transcriptional LysR family regulator